MDSDTPDDDRDADGPPPSFAGPDDAVLKTRVPPRGPWIYRKMLRFPAGHVRNGAYVRVLGKDGRPLGHGLLNRRSEIALRVVGGPEDRDFGRALRDRLRAAHDLRTQVLGLHEVTDAARIVHGEADGLSGLVVDRYGGTLVAHLYALGYVANADVLEAELRRLPGVKRVLFHGDPRAAELEGFDPPKPPAGATETVRENGVVFAVDLAQGHKTGLFLDQRDNRATVASFCKGRTVLDLCTNAGGFALHAAKAEAKSVTAVDLDEKALAHAERNAELNKVRVAWKHADAFDDLRARREARERFEVVVLDPHKLATGKGEVQKALKTYFDLNRLALDVVAPGGLFATFSCSGAVTETVFTETVADAAHSLGRRARVLATLGAAPDHPFALEFLEGRYLKGLLIHVT
jgi:23S rRNA (cytosine1962-C5)-methyltransferase